ncbi:hypothetical protein, partial [Streptomyces sp. ECR2.10]
LEEAPDTPTETSAPETTAPALVPVILSGAGVSAVRAQAERLRGWLESSAVNDVRVADIGLASVTTRTVLEHRAVVLAADPEELLVGLNALADGKPAPALVQGADSRTGKTVLLFAGQGSQRLGMGRELYETYPVFAEAFD